MKKNKPNKNTNRITDNDFVRAEDFNDYNIPLPDSARKRRNKKTQRTVRPSEGTKMPERQEAERRLQRQREQLETLEYVRRQELAREAEVRKQKELQKRMLMQQTDQEEPDEPDDKAGRITVTSVYSDEPEDEIREDMQPVEAEGADYDDNAPSFTYLSMKDGKISEMTEEDEIPPGQSEPDDEFFDGEYDDEYDGGEEQTRSISQKINPETATVTDIRQERKKQKNRRIIKRVIALVIIVGLGVGVYMTSKWWIPKLEGILDKPHSTIVNDGKTEGGNFPLKIDQAGIITLSQCNDIMVTLDGNKVVFYNDDGTQLNAISHNYGTPVIDVCGKRIVAYDNAGKNFQVMTKKNTVYSKKTDNPIVMAKIGSNGYVAVVTQTEKYSAFVTVYDETGAEIYTWASGRRVVGICFNEDGKGCCISAIASAGGKINSVVYAVKFDSKQAVMTSAPLDTVVLQARLNKSGEYWVIGDDRFMVLDASGKDVYTQQYDTQLVSFDMNDRYASYFTDSVTGTHGKVFVYDSEKDGHEPTMQTDVQGKPQKLQLHDGTVIVFTNRTVESYDSKGNRLATADVSQDYVDFVYASKAVYLLGYRDINKIKFDT